MKKIINVMNTIVLGIILTVFSPLIAYLGSFDYHSVKDVDGIIEMVIKKYNSEPVIQAIYKHDMQALQEATLNPDTIIEVELGGRSYSFNYLIFAYYCNASVDTQRTAQIIEILVNKGVNIFGRWAIVYHVSSKPMVSNFGWFMAAKGDEETFRVIYELQNAQGKDQLFSYVEEHKRQDLLLVIARVIATSPVTTQDDHDRFLLIYSAVDEEGKNRLLTYSMDNHFVPRYNPALV
jgi:hypothetical protein